MDTVIASIVSVQIIGLSITFVLSTTHAPIPIQVLPVLNSEVAVLQRYATQALVVTIPTLMAFVR